MLCGENPKRENRENFSNSFPKLESLGERERERDKLDPCDALKLTHTHTHTHVRHFNYVPLFIHAELN
jgi:hypothetical protein